MTSTTATRLLLLALFSVALGTSASAVTIHTDGNHVTAVSALQVAGRGTFDVDFSFDTFANLFGSTTAPSPVPTFFNDPLGGAAAASALAVELTNAGSLLGLKDDQNGTMTPDANIPVTPSTNGVVVEGLVSSSGTWLTYSQLFFSSSTNFMHAVFTPSAVPEPTSFALLGLAAAASVLGRKRRIARSTGCEAPVAEAAELQS